MSDFMLKVGLYNKITTYVSLFVKCVRIIYMINIPDLNIVYVTYIYNKLFGLCEYYYATEINK